MLRVRSTPDVQASVLTCPDPPERFGSVYSEILIALWMLGLAGADAPRKLGSGRPEAGFGVTPARDWLVAPSMAEHARAGAMAQERRHHGHPLPGDHNQPAKSSTAFGRRPNVFWSTWQLEQASSVPWRFALAIAPFMIFFTARLPSSSHAALTRG